MNATLKTTRKQPVGRPWPKGVSGNPGGRPAAKEANALLASLWDEAIAGGKTRGERVLRDLFDLAADKDKSIRLRAISEILDRRLGKPTQAVEIQQTAVSIKVVHV